jgi:phosphoenolpyruvate carboxylase
MKRTRKIPQIMATQHPDNAFGPYWRSGDDSPYVSTNDEVPECFHAFSDLDCDEFMWDWEGKFVDEAVIDRLYHNYADYFKKNALGKDKFLTFRIPNTSNESGVRLARAFMGIITAAQAAKNFGMHSPPMFEVILPMTTSADQLIAVIKKFKKLTGYEEQIFEKVFYGNHPLDVIPLIEGSVSLLESKPLLKKYVKKYRGIYGKNPKYLRPFIARSDPALDAGYVPAVLAARAALSEYYAFEKESKIKVYPILGVGSLNFRGGLAPDNCKRFLKNYAGVRTVTIQSSFRYDHPQEEVQNAVKYLKRNLAKKNASSFSKDELDEILGMCQSFARHYRKTVQALSTDISKFSRFIPKHRERIPHSGHFGYSRKVGKSKVGLPRAIGFTAVFFSLGVPPTLIGTGRGIAQFKKRGLIKELENYLPCLKEELAHEMQYFNAENLELLIKKNKAWAEVQKDVQEIIDYIGDGSFKVDPVYRNITSNVFHYWSSKKHDYLKEAILEAAKIRKCLG